MLGRSWQRKAYFEKYYTFFSSFVFKSFPSKVLFRPRLAFASLNFLPKMPCFMYEKVIEKKDNRKRRNGIDCSNAFLTKFLQLALLSSGFNNHNKKWKIILH